MINKWCNNLPPTTQITLIEGVVGRINGRSRRGDPRDYLAAGVRECGSLDYFRLDVGCCGTATLKEGSLPWSRVGRDILHGLAITLATCNEVQARSRQGLHDNTLRRAAPDGTGPETGVDQVRLGCHNSEEATRRQATCGGEHRHCDTRRDVT